MFCSQLYELSFVFFFCTRFFLSFELSSGIIALFQYRSVPVDLLCAVLVKYISVCLCAQQYSQIYVVSYNRFFLKQEHFHLIVTLNFSTLLFPPFLLPLLTLVSLSPQFPCSTGRCHHLRWHYPHRQEGWLWLILSSGQAQSFLSHFTPIGMFLTQAQTIS